MIDDEPDDLAQAFRPEPGLIAVPCDDEQTGSRCRLEYLLPRIAVALYPGAGTVEPDGCRIKQLGGRCRG